MSAIAFNADNVFTVVVLVGIVVLFAWLDKR